MPQKLFSLDEIKDGSILKFPHGDYRLLSPFSAFWDKEAGRPAVLIDGWKLATVKGGEGTWPIGYVLLEIWEDGTHVYKPVR